MSRWPTVAAVVNMIAIGLLTGCDLGWDFLQDGASGNVGAQTNCAISRVVTGQLPPSSGLHHEGSFSATYSSPRLSGTTSNTALGLRISRHRLWLDDMTIEVSFFPFDDTARDPRNACLGRSILEINIPFEHLVDGGQSVNIQSTVLSQTEVSAYYAEGGEPGFTASAVNGTLRIQSIDDRRVQVLFDFTFNPGPLQRRLTRGEILGDVNENPAAQLFQ